MFLRLYPTEKLVYIPIEKHRIEQIISKLPIARFNAQNTTPEDHQIVTSKEPIKAKMGLSRKSLAGSGYIILNAIRVLNVIGFLAVIAASVVMLVKTSVGTKFFFFDALSHVLTCITGMFLLASELSLFRGYYARNWPLLSPAHGFVTLALAMIVLGINMLGNLNKPATSQKALGLAFWRIVIASGIIVFFMGWVNLIASYVFRERKKGITARQVRAHGAVAELKSPSLNHGTPSASELGSSYAKDPVTPTKNGGPFRNLTAERRQSVLPSYHTASPKSDNVPPYPSRDPISPSSRYSRATACTKKKVFGLMGRNRNSIAPPLPVNTQDRPMEISPPMGVNPQFAHLVQRPDSALHPSRGTGESEAFRWKAVS